jgi:hypothetical protein
MTDISTIYQRWLHGDIAQEDALFAIGDVLRAADQARHGGPEPGHAPGQCASAPLQQESAPTEADSGVRDLSEVEDEARASGSGRR